MSAQISAKKGSVPANSFLFELAWEVCQKLGGIYTVVRSKAAVAVRRWGKNYCMVGPYNPELSPREFEQQKPPPLFAKMFAELESLGVKTYYGFWLVRGRPNVVLLDYSNFADSIENLRRRMMPDFFDCVDDEPEIVDAVLCFAKAVELFFQVYCRHSKRRAIVHMHEWMSAVALPFLLEQKLPLHLVFTTHATKLGRELADSLPDYDQKLHAIDCLAHARSLGLEAHLRLERRAAQAADVFCTVSSLTALECEHLLGRKPDVLQPNGLNIERFEAMHKFQNLHRLYKDKIHEFVMAHFFPSYSFDLDTTLYFFTSGRYEYVNKGFDLSISAMSQLNERLKKAGVDRTIVFFIITKAEHGPVLSEVFRRKMLFEETRRACRHITERIGEKLMQSVAMRQMPTFAELADDSDRLKLRRILHESGTEDLPPIVTHEMNDQVDPILRRLQQKGLFNAAEDRVKVVYYPEFMSSGDTLMGIDYDEFVRGCHAGVFPSYYEPWGYTPLECLACGVPSATSNLSGFGTYLQEHVPEYRKYGLFVSDRRQRPFDESVNALADWMFTIARMTRRARIAQRNRVERLSARFDWSRLYRYYEEAYQLATKVDREKK